MKIRSFLLPLLALGFLTSSAQANFWDFIRNYDWGSWGDHEYTTNTNTEKYDGIWTYLCGGEKREWDCENPDDHYEFGSLLDKFREICGENTEVNEWCDKLVEENNFHTYEGGDYYHRTHDYCEPKPPSSSIPEPSTYGMFRAGVLI